MQNKTKHIAVRITKKQNKKLEKLIKKSKIKSAQFLRQSILNGLIIDSDILINWYNELRSQGNNLNQITKKLNSNENVSNDILLKEIEDLKQKNNTTQETLLKLLKEVRL